MLTIITIVYLIHLKCLYQLRNDKIPNLKLVIYDSLNVKAKHQRKLRKKRTMYTTSKEMKKKHQELRTMKKAIAKIVSWLLKMYKQLTRILRYLKTKPLKQI